MDTFGSDNPLTALVPKLEGVDPDDAFSSVPYEKGFALLYYLESLLGGPGTISNSGMLSYASIGELQRFSISTFMPMSTISSIRLSQLMIGRASFSHTFRNKLVCSNVKSTYH